MNGPTLTGRRRSGVLVPLFACPSTTSWGVGDIGDIGPITAWLADRARALRMFLSEQAWWIEDYSVFRAIHARDGERQWMEWPPDWQQRTPAAINAIRRELAQEVLFYQYLQWQAALQWRRARETAHGVQLFGDPPFMVDGD